MNGKKGSALAEARNRPADPDAQAALKRFLKKHDLSCAALGRVLGLDSSQLAFVHHGYRGYSTCMARLYILTGEDAFKPKTEPELEAYSKECEHPLASIKQFKETGRVPSPNDRKHPRKGASVRTSASSSRKSAEPAKKLAEPKGEEPSQLIASPFFDRILAGVVEVGGQFRDGLRFFLTRDNFRQFGGSITEAEVIDTLRLVTELRRRFSIFAQLTDKKERARVASLLRPEVNELYVTIEASRAAMPTEAGYLLADLRQQLAAIKLPFGSEGQS